MKNSIHNALNQLLAHTNCQYRYDANGNLIEKQGNHSILYRYDALDRLIEVQDGLNVTSYAYDSFHRRLSKTHNGKTTHYLYQGENEIGALECGIIKELRILGLGLGAEIGAAVALEFDGQVYAPIHDPYGNITTLVDACGNHIESYRYGAFGEKQIINKTLNNPWGYASKRLI